MSRCIRNRNSPLVWWTIACYVAIAASLDGTVRSATAAELRWKLKAGAEFHYLLTQDTQVRSIAAGKTEKTTISQTIDMTWKIVSVDASGVAKLDLKIDRIQIKGLTPQGKFEADSQEEGLPPPLNATIGPTFKALVGKVFSLMLTPSGHVTDAKPPEEPDEKGNSDTGAAGLSADSISQMIKHSTVPLPEGPIDPGNSWTEERDLPDAKIEMHYTYEGPVDTAGQSLDGITTNADIKVQVPETPGFKSELVKGTLTGDARFDSKRGRLVESKLNQEVVLSITSAEQSLRQEILSIVKLQLVPPNDQARPAAKPGDAR